MKLIQTTREEVQVKGDEIPVTLKFKSDGNVECIYEGKSIGWISSGKSAVFLNGDIKRTVLEWSREHKPEQPGDETDSPDY